MNDELAPPFRLPVELVGHARSADQVWYTRDEAAEYLRMDPRSLDRYIKDGHLKVHRAAGIGNPRINKVDLDSLMQES